MYYYLYLDINKEAKSSSSKNNEMPQMTKTCNLKTNVETESVNLSQNKPTTNIIGSPTLTEGLYLYLFILCFDLLKFYLFNNVYFL